MTFVVEPLNSLWESVPSPFWLLYLRVNDYPIQLDYIGLFRGADHEASDASGRGDQGGSVHYWAKEGGRERGSRATHVTKLNLT
jgi:hypothetical protein